MPSEPAVLDALRGVDDPDLGRSIVDLGMVQRLDVGRKAVRMTVAVPTDGIDSGPELRRRIMTAVGAVAEVGTVEVDLVEMSPSDRQALAARLRPPAGPGAARSNPFTEGTTRVLAIASGKGGVGKSSVTSNLSIALAQAGKRVGALDADVWGFSMPRMLGATRPPAVIDDVVIPPSVHGVRVVSMGFFAREDQPVIWRGPMLHKALEQFLTDVFWDDPDFLVIDMPPGTGDVAISMAQFVPRSEVIVVTTPQPAAQKVAQRAAYMARKVNLAVVGVIENMSWFAGDDGKRYEIFGSGGGQTLADDLGVPLLGQVPLVPALREGADDGRPIMATDPDHEASRAFAAIAERIITELAPKKIFKRELKII